VRCVGANTLSAFKGLLYRRCDSKMVLVKVKHGKEQYECEFDTTKDVKTFKTALEKLTGVPPERQTLMSKGCWIGTLKDDKDLSTLKPIKDGHLVTLMGSAAKVADAPVEVSTDRNSTSHFLLASSHHFSLPIPIDKGGQIY
jgi:hypothetical protein